MITRDAPAAPDLLSIAPVEAPPQYQPPADVALVPPSHCFDVVLPQKPVGRRDLMQMIAAHMPVRPKFVAWTDPIAAPDGGARLWVAKRAWLDQFVGELEKTHGRALEVRTEQDGLPFNYVSPASRRARLITIGTWLASVIAAGMVLSAMSENDTSVRPPSSAYAASVAEPPTFRRAGLLAIMRQLPVGQLPVGLLAGVSSASDGSLQLDLNTQDPDMLRELLTEEEMLPGFREIEQGPSPQGTYLATYEMEAPSANNNGPGPSRRVPVLRAGDTAEAIATVKRSLASYAAAQGAQLSVVDPALGSEGGLEFEIEMTGSQEGVLAAATAIESGAPPIRFAEWRIIPGGIGNGRESVRLTGTLIVPWTRSQ